jgi:hypothetical protein
VDDAAYAHLTDVADGFGTLNFLTFQPKALVKVIARAKYYL